LRKGVPQSAKLVKTGNDYEIHVSFLFETLTVEVATVLGVRRGIYNLASLCMLDRDGRILYRENVEGRSIRASQIREEQRQRETQKKARRYRSTVRLALADEAVHAAANRIVDVAVKYGAQVVLADLRSLTARGRKRARSKFNHVMNRGQYAKLERVLEYKLALEGLPKPKGVAAAGTSRTCPRCGEWHSGNIPKAPGKDALAMSRFLCITCGYEDDADLNAARVIGQKKRWREQLPLKWRAKRAVEIPEEVSLPRMSVSRFFSATILGTSPRCGCFTRTDFYAGLSARIWQGRRSRYGKLFGHERRATASSNKRSRIAVGP
jgi:IS605 OrfB family transposase